MNKMHNVTTYLVWKVIKDLVYPDKKHDAAKLATKLIKLGYTSTAIENKFLNLGYLDFQKSNPTPPWDVVTRHNFFDKKLIKKKRTFLSKFKRFFF